MFANSTYYYKDINKVFSFIQAPIAVIGIVGNILAICVFERKELKKYSYSFYWKSLAFFKSLILLHVFRNCAKHILNYDIDLISSFFCRFNEYQPYVGGMVVLCLETLITLDRYVKIIYGKRTNTCVFKNRSFGYVSVLVIIVYSMLFNIQLPLNYRLEQINGSWTCHIPSEALKSNSTFILINVVVLQLFTNTILDVSIICHIFSIRSNIRRVNNRFSLIDRQFAISAISINISSLVLKMPFILGNFIGVHMNLGAEKLEMIHRTCLTSSMINKSDLFFISMLVNSVFRQEFFSMIRCEPKNKASNRISLRPIEISSSSPITSQPETKDNLLQVT